MAQKLLVYQSLWAMERRRPDGQEWSLSEKLSMIRDAGFIPKQRDTLYRTYFLN